MIILGTPIAFGIIIFTWSAYTWRNIDKETENYQ